MYPIGCAGVITHSEPLPDGRFNIVLRGLEKFRMTGEESGQPYRIAHVEALPSRSPTDEKTQMHAASAAARAPARASRWSIVAATRNCRPIVPDDDLVNALAQYLALEPIERQALLECDGVLSRCGALIELLEMRSMMAPGTGSWTSGLAH